MKRVLNIVTLPQLITALRGKARRNGFPAARAPLNCHSPFQRPLKSSLSQKDPEHLNFFNLVARLTVTLQTIGH
ncbi:MAG TPA: hypothetical protein VK633_12740 [Verrucomicrobiae bacterium]|nr:hypothetical protein [Verrucomicrobiae bacterium]